MSGQHVNVISGCYCQGGGGDSVVFTEGGREDGSGGLWRGSSSIGNVEKVNCGVWVYFHSNDCLKISVTAS